MVRAPYSRLRDIANVSPRRDSSYHAAMVAAPARIRIADVCQRTGLTPRTVQSLALRGEIPGAAKLGRSWTFDAAKLAHWLADAEIAVIVRARAARVAEPTHWRLAAPERNGTRLQAIIAERLKGTGELRGRPPLNNRFLPNAGCLGYDCTNPPIGEALALKSIAGKRTCSSSTFAAQSGHVRSLRRQGFLAVVLRKQLGEVWSTG